MNKYKFIILAVIWAFAFACQKNDPPEDPCSQLVDGEYKFPTEPPDVSLTSSQKIEYWNIPEDVLQCLATDGLIETCLKYNNLGAILFLFGTDGIQDGYNLARERCSGFPELENRTDAFNLLIEKYKSIDTINFVPDTNPLEYGGYNYFTYSLEVILGQEKILQNLTDNQKIELLTDLFIKQDCRNNLHSWYSIESTVFAMARIMYFNNYMPLINECQENSIMNSFIIEGIPIQREDIKSSIISFATDYLNLLKSSREGKG